jgi:hypothetical protein
MNKTCKATDLIKQKNGRLTVFFVAYLQFSGIGILENLSISLSSSA